MVRHIADSDADVMAYLTGLERELITEVEADDIRHMEIIESLEILGSNFAFQRMDFIFLSGSILPVTG